MTHPPNYKDQRTNFVTSVAVEGLQPITQSSQQTEAKHPGQETVEQTQVSYLHFHV